MSRCQRFFGVVRWYTWNRSRIDDSFYLSDQGSKLVQSEPSSPNNLLEAAFGHSDHTLEYTTPPRNSGQDKGQLYPHTWQVTLYLLKVHCSSHTTSVKTYIHILFSVAVLPDLIWRGSAKSTPVKVKGGFWHTQNSGSRGGGGPVKGLPSNLLQTTHWWIHIFTNAWPLTIQNLEQTSVSVSFTPLSQVCRSYN